VGRSGGPRRVLAGLVLALVVSAATSAHAQFDHQADLLRYSCPDDRVPAGGFTDVAPGSTHGRAIACVAWWRIAQGRVDGSFGPQGHVTRAQMASFVHRFLRVSGERFDRGAPTPFRDVGGVHAVAIAELAAVDVVRGTSATTFSPDRPITRGQAASLLSRATLRVSGLSRPDTERRFDDVDGVHDGAVHHLAHLSVAAGTGPRTFSPDRPVTRAQVASLLARLQGSQVMMRHVIEHWYPRFHPAEATEGLRSATAIASGDLTGDGRDELVVTGGSSAVADPEHPRSNWLHVVRTGVEHADAGVELLARGPTGSSETHYPVRSVAVGDVTGDGRHEIVVPLVDGRLEAWRVTDDGQLTRVEGELPVVDPWSVLRIADVDGDGRDDLVSLGADADAQLEVRRSTAPGTFGEATRVEVPHDIWTDVVPGDLTGDGSVDLLVTGDPTAFATVVVDRDGSYDVRSYPQSSPVRAALVVDAVGDGRVDVVLARDRVHVHPLLAGGRLGPATTYTGELTGLSGGLLAGDVTGDGVVDLGVVAPYAERIDVLVGDGDGGLDLWHDQVRVPSVTVAAQGGHVLDVTGDGVEDLVLTTPQQGLLVLPGY
jgi:hypothetical protein